ncbi:MAG: GNAT family N-acetyltransferase [Verrucomicrobia bacterium]|nr:GNAT family N-acetyltransferase [Verrucomicrobiota bacterium]
MSHSESLELRPTVPADLEQCFEFQLDPEANWLAAFTAKDPTDRAAYLEKYGKCLQNPTIHMRTVVVDGRIVGSVAKYEMDGSAEVTYWLDRATWGRGLATRVLRAFLELERARPIRARVAFDNFGSQRVLEKCGFVRIGSDRGFANARQCEIEEFIYRKEGI